MTTIHQVLAEASQQGRKLLAVLVDPDRANREYITQLGHYAQEGLVDYFFWGGSLVNEPQADYYLALLKSLSPQPVILFPGSMYQLNERADGLLLLSLLSGRNPDLLIGQHVLVAAKIKQLRLATTPTAYLLIDGGAPTSVSYMSNTQPIPADKPQIAAATALAGEQLGMQLIYLDAGSGAKKAVSAAMIEAVRKEVKLPIVVGGGIRDAAAALQALEAGADLIVVGNALEEQASLLPQLAAAVAAASNKELLVHSKLAAQLKDR